MFLYYVLNSTKSLIPVEVSFVFSLDCYHRVAIALPVTIVSLTFEVLARN